MYTLDLVKQVGIRYIWDGDISGIVGQDRAMSASTYFKSTATSFIKALVKIILYYAFPLQRIRKVLKLHLPNNQQYFPYKFPDGNKLYCFRRYGTWKDADIYGLGKIIAPSKIDELINNNATLVAYTHLGKRPASKTDLPYHIPDITKTSLQYIKKKYHDQELMVSTLSELLDYLVIRDNIKYDAVNNLIQLKPDKIRYQKITQADLSGIKISFNDEKGKMDLKSLKVITLKENLLFDIIKEDAPNIFSIKFK